MAKDHDYVSKQAIVDTTSQHNVLCTSPPVITAEEDIAADVDEPPEIANTPRPAPLKLTFSSLSTFAKSSPVCDRKKSLLTSALKSTSTEASPTEVESDKSPARGMSCVSTWSNYSGTTAELTSDGGCTSPGERTSTPSPPLPSATFQTIIPMFNKKPLQLPVAVVSHEDENVKPLQAIVAPVESEQKVEAALGRKRCIMFACGQKKDTKPVEAPVKPVPPPTSDETPKRVCTIKFACPTKISTAAPTKPGQSRRMMSPPPLARRMPASISSRAHRDSDSTVRNKSPVSVRKQPSLDRARRLSLNSDLAKCEKYRFHEFASSEEEVDEWTQEVTCHRSRLTVQDTLKIENNLRQLGEEAEEEALEDEEEDDEDIDEDDEDLDDDQNDSDALSDITDEGFQTDDEEGFAGSDNESDAESDYNWWTPGPSTAATSVEHLEQLRMKARRTISESSIGSLESRQGLTTFKNLAARRGKSKPVNIRAPSPELPDSTDFVCGTLDEDRPAEEAYMSILERRRAAKHKVTPQDIDPTFPTSDPELPDEDEDEVSDVEQPASESDFMLHGRMDPVEGDLRGRRQEVPKKRSPQQSPKRLRSPPPPMKRNVHRSPPPRKLFGQSPKALSARLRLLLRLRVPATYSTWFG